MRICLFDQLDLPGAVPFFQTLLALNGELNLIELLIIDQSVNGVSPAESADRIRAMLVDAADEIVGDTDVKRSAYIAGNNVDAVGAVGAHARSWRIPDRPVKPGDDRQGELSARAGR